MVHVAALQITSGPDIGENITKISAMVREAAARGATFIATPENSCHIVFPSERKLQTAPYEKDHLGIPAMQALAKELGVWILIGSFAIKISETKVTNRSYLFSDTGDIAGQYDKVHLFDVDLPTGEQYRESKAVTPGDKVVVVDAPWGKLGLSICYDIRFPHFFREMTQKLGATMLAIPAAFTVPTGQAHWEILLRARAIENGCFVIAPAQTGTHDGGRKTYGHSLIIDPWGTVLADGKDAEGIVMANCDMQKVIDVRASIPSLQHDRPFTCAIS